MANLTRRAIKAALIQLLDERPISQITVKDIVSVCGINRNTFYYHYPGIPELLEEIINDEAEAIIRKFPTVGTLEECLASVVRAAMEKKRAALHIYNSTSREVYEQYQWSACRRIVTLCLDTMLRDRQLPEQDYTVIHHYYTCLSFGFFSAWLSSGMKEEVLTEFERIAELQQGALEEMIERVQAADAEAAKPLKPMPPLHPVDAVQEMDPEAEEADSEAGDPAPGRHPMRFL